MTEMVSTEMQGLSTQKAWQLASSRGYHNQKERQCSRLTLVLVSGIRTGGVGCERWDVVADQEQRNLTPDSLFKDPAVKSMKSIH